MVHVSFDFKVYKLYLFHIYIDTFSHIDLQIGIFRNLARVAHCGLRIENLVDEVLITESTAIGGVAERFQVLGGFFLSQQKIILHELLYGNSCWDVGSFQTLVEEVEGAQEMFEKHVVLRLDHTLELLVQTDQLGLDYI